MKFKPWKPKNTNSVLRYYSTDPRGGYLFKSGQSIDFFCGDQAYKKQVFSMLIKHDVDLTVK